MSGRRIFTVEVDLNSPQSKKYHTMYVLEDTGGGSGGKDRPIEGDVTWGDIKGDIGITTALLIEDATKDITATLTNKTVDAEYNKISNLETEDFKSSALASSSNNVRTYDNSVDTKVVTEKFLLKTLHNIELPEEDKDAANKKYVDDLITELNGKILKFKGFVSTTTPTGSIKNGSLWYESNILPSAFPINVKTYNSTTNQWSTTTSQYTPESLDLWANLNDDKGYYWFGNGWNMIDDNGRFLYVSTFTGVIGNPAVLYYLDTAYSTYEKGFYRFIPASGGNPAKFILLNKELFKYVSTFTGVTGDVDRLYFLDTEYDSYKVGFYRFIEAQGSEPAKFIRINPSPIKYVSTFNGVVGNIEDLYYLDTEYDNYEVGFYRFVEATTTEPLKFILLNKQRFKYVSTFTGEIGDINRLYYLDTTYDNFKKGFYRYNGTTFVNINPNQFFYVSTFTGIEGDDESLYYLDTSYDTYKIGFYRFIPAIGVEPAKFVLIGRPLVEYVSTFNNVIGDTDVLYYLDTKYGDYKVGFYRYVEAQGATPAKFLLIGSASEVFTDIDVNESLPTTDINANTIYRKATYKYLHSEEELESLPAGYKIVDTENISVSTTGITIDGTETLWGDLTDTIVSGLVTAERLAETNFTEADFFNYNTTLFDIASNFERETTYTLYYNPTATADKYIQIGGGSVMIDNKTIVENLSNELQANAIIEVDTLPTSVGDIKKNTLYKTDIRELKDKDGFYINPSDTYIADGTHVQVLTNGLQDVGNDILYEWTNVDNALITQFVNSSYLTLTDDYGDEQEVVCIGKLEENIYTYCKAVLNKVLYTYGNNSWKLVTDYKDIKNCDEYTISTNIYNKLESKAIIDVNALPTSGIYPTIIYRILEDVYLYDGEEIEIPQGYRGTSENITVTNSGITFNSTEYPFATLTDAQFEEITDKETCSFDDAEWFKIRSNKYDYNTTVTKEQVYKLYHNPTGQENEYIKIGGEGGSADVEIDNTTITKVNDKLQANAIIEVDVLPTSNIKEKSVYKIVDKVPEYTDSETIYHDMVKYYYREDGNWVNHSVVNLTQDLYDNLSTEQKTDGTIYVVDDATPVIQGFTYNELANKPSINGITLQNALSLEDLSLYSRSLVNALLEGKGQVEFVNALPATPTTNTWYYSKKYEDGTDVPDDKRVLYIVDEDTTVYNDMGIVGDIEMETGDTLTGSEHLVTSSQVVKKEMSTKVNKYGTQVNVETTVDDATLWTMLAQIGTADKKTDSSMVFNAGTCYLISSVSPTKTAQIFQFIVTGSVSASAINKKITLINPLTNELFTKSMDSGVWQAWKGGKKYKHTLVRYNNDSFEYPMGWASIINNKKTITFNDFKNWLKEKGYTTSENSYYLCGGCCGTTGVRNSADTDTAYVGKVASGIFYNEFKKTINKVTYPADTLYFRWDYNGTTQINPARCKVYTEELN